jgi:hypothetical protein
MSCVVDKTTLDLVSIVLGGTGLFVVLTKFNVPELNAWVIGASPFVIKRDWIDSTMTWLFTGLALLGLLIQVGAAIWGDHIQQRVHTPCFYLLAFAVMVAGGVLLAWLLTVVGRHLARRLWLPRIIDNQKDLYKTARFIIEHDGHREDQLHDRKTNLEAATKSVAQIEKLLDLPSRSTDLTSRLDAIKPFFERQ